MVAEFAVEFDDEQMRDAELADQSDLVLRRGDQVRSIVRPKNFPRMRIECHDDRRACSGMGVTRRGGNDRLVTEMDAVKDSDGEKKRSAKLGQFGNGMKGVQEGMANDE